jgi:hypothetical protein
VELGQGRAPKRIREPAGGPGGLDGEDRDDREGGSECELAHAGGEQGDAVR